MSDQACSAALSLESLAMEVAARLDERLSVERPQQYGAGITVQAEKPHRGGLRIIVDQPRGPRFAVDVREVTRP